MGLTQERSDVGLTQVRSDVYVQGVQDLCFQWNSETGECEMGEFDRH